MKGLIVFGNGQIEMRNDIPMPELSDYTAIVKNVACGICNGTDIKLRTGGLHHFENYPAVLGHESTGYVIKTGKKVRNYKEGDLVLRSGLDNMLPKYHSLWGSFAEYGRVTDCQAMKEDGLSYDEGQITQRIVPGDIDPVDATMIITLNENYSALKRLGIFEGAAVAISGCGPVGLSMLRLSKLLGASFVAFSGHHDSRLAVAKKFGADVIVNSKRENFADRVRKEAPRKLDFYIDAVGRCDIISEALGLIKEDGVIGLYGIGLEEDRGIDWFRGAYNWRLHSVQWPIPKWEYEAHEPVVQYIQNGDIDLKDFVSHRLPFDEYEEGFRLVQSREGLKVALYFEGN